MSMTESPSAPSYRKPSGWRRFFVGSALVLAGVIVGVGTSALSQGYGRGWSEDGPGRYERFDGPRGFFRDHDGPRGWHGRWFGRDRDDDGRGWHHGRGFGGFGGPFLSPGRIERMVDRLGWAVDASREQKQKIAGIVQRAADDLRPLREKHLEGRRAMREALAAATIDRGKLETLRTEQMKLADEASRRIVAAVTEAAEVLTPEQRADLARRLERFGGRRG
jgi:periplasmic protein CpxP/Spy